MVYETKLRIDVEVDLTSMADENGVLPAGAHALLMRRYGISRHIIRDICEKHNFSCERGRPTGRPQHRNSEMLESLILNASLIIDGHRVIAPRAAYQIADAVGCNRSSVYRAYKRLGVVIALPGYKKRLKIT